MRKCPVCSSIEHKREWDGILVCAICSAFIGEAPMNIDKMRIKAVNKLVELGWVFKDNEWMHPSQGEAKQVYGAGMQQLNPLPQAGNSSSNYELAFKQVHRVFEDYNRRDPHRTIQYVDLYSWVQAIRNSFNLNW